MILDDIIEKTKYDLERRKKDITLEMMGRSLSHNPYPPRDVRKFLTATKEEPIRIIAEVKKAMLDGTFKAFEGPVLDQTGKVRVPKGEVLADKDLLSMNWFVQGVDGYIAK